MKLAYKTLTRLILYSFLLIATAPLPASAKIVEPIPFPGVELTCADLNANDADFPNIHTDRSLNYAGAPSATTSTSSQFRDNGNWTYSGTDNDIEGTLSIQGAMLYGWNHVNAVNWSLNAPNAKIIALIVVSENNSNVFYYPAPGVVADGPDETLDKQPIKRLSFCINPHGTTAAEVSISGRAMDTLGNAIAMARVTATNASTGIQTITATNENGDYEIPGLPVGEFYFITIAHRRYVFENHFRQYMIHDSVTGEDFVGWQRKMATKVRRE